MTAQSDANSGQADTGALGDLVDIVAVSFLSFLPPAAASAFPPEVLEDKNQSFITLYFLTLPW
jgi:hypothetical protein